MKELVNKSNNNELEESREEEQTISISTTTTNKKTNHHRSSSTIFTIVTTLALYLVFVQTRTSVSVSRQASAADGVGVGVGGVLITSDTDALSVRRSSNSTSTASSGTTSMLPPPPAPSPDQPITTTTTTEDINHLLKNSNAQEDQQHNEEDRPYFAACLMVMDDNHWLIEWLAYHYFVLPLRRLIIHTDPDSKTSPQHILERWNLTARGGIRITHWNTTDDFNPFGNNLQSSPLRQHRLRQKRFLSKCMIQLKSEQLEQLEQQQQAAASSSSSSSYWTLFTDPDEYVLINPKYRDTKYLRTKFGTSQREPGSIMTFLNKHYHSLQYRSPCLSITRKQFVSNTMEEEDDNNNNNKEEPTMATNLNTTTQQNLQTFRWRYSQKPPFNKAGIPGKSMIDLSRVSMETILEQSSEINPHVPLPQVCLRGSEWYSESKTSFVAYHYMGTLQQVLFRSNDKRGSGGTGSGARGGGTGGGGRGSQTGSEMGRRTVGRSALIARSTSTSSSRNHPSTTTASNNNKDNNNNNNNGTNNGTAYRLERYNNQNQPPQSMNRYYRQNQQVEVEKVPDIIQYWLEGFTQQVGLDEAERLLQDVGDPTKAAAAPTETVG